MNSRIKILCIILSLIYAGLIISSVAPAFEIFKTGIDLGKVSSNKNTRYEIYHFNVVPKTINFGNYTFPTTLTNVATGEEIKAEATGYKVGIAKSQDENHSLGGIIVLIIKLILSLIIIGLIVYIPILFFGIVKASTKGNIIEAGVIKKVSKLGWSLIGILTIDILVIGSDYITIKQLIELEHYRIMMDYSSYYLLILGTVTLLLAEVLKVSLNLKEEQELTI